MIEGGKGGSKRRGRRGRKRKEEMLYFDYGFHKGFSFPTSEEGGD